MRRDDGFTLTEFMVTAAVMVLVVTAAVTTAVPLMARENLRAATYQLHSTIQVSQVEAISRNTQTRFVIDTDSNLLEVWDTKGTAATGDDELLRQKELPKSVRVASPDSEEPITLAEVSGTHGAYEAVFKADGSVTKGNGRVSLYGGGMFRKLNLDVAGGVNVNAWDDGGWKDSDCKSTELESQWESIREGYVDDWQDQADAEANTTWDWNGEQWVSTNSYSEPTL